MQLGKALSIETLAEGIEQSQELDALQDESCDSGQGFLFARPLDAEAIEAFFGQWPSQPVLESETQSSTAVSTQPLLIQRASAEQLDRFDLRFLQIA